MDNTTWIKGMQALANKSISKLKKDIELIENDTNILPDAKQEAVEVIKSVIRFKKGKLLKPKSDEKITKVGE